MVDAWREDLAEWLGPFVGLLGDRRRARMCSADVEGLIGPRDRKSVQPMAMRSPGIGYDHSMRTSIMQRHCGDRGQKHEAGDVAEPNRD